MTRLDRRVVAVWRWTLAFWGACVTLAATGLGWMVLHDTTRWWTLVAPAGLLLTALLAWRGPALAWAHWSYRLANDALELSHGILFREHSVVPWSRVQHVDISHGPLDRRYGLAQLRIHTASAKTDAKLPGIDADEAEGMRLDILERYRRAIEPS